MLDWFGLIVWFRCVIYRIIYIYISMGGQLDGNFLPGSLPHKFVSIVTSIICSAKPWTRRWSETKTSTPSRQKAAKRLWFLKKLKRAEVDGTHAGIAQLSLQQGTATEKRNFKTSCCSTDSKRQHCCCHLGLLKIVDIDRMQDIFNTLQYGWDTSSPKASHITWHTKIKTRHSYP